MFEQKKISNRKRSLGEKRERERNAKSLGEKRKQQPNHQDLPTARLKSEGELTDTKFERYWKFESD